MNNLSEMKTSLRAIAKSSRSVSMWNAMREDFKLKYSSEDIYKLDASGYITKWLKGE